VTRQLNSFQGPLEKDQLFSLLGYLKSSLSTGRLELVSNLTGERGHIYLQAGQVIHAERGHLTGKFAMIRLSTLGDGRFDFTVGETAPHATIGESLENLAISVAVAVDEASLTGEFPAETTPPLDLDGPLELLTPPANLSVTLEMDMLGLLPLVKPNSTLRSINQSLRWPEARLLEVAATLVKNKMLRVDPAPQVTVDPAFVQALRQAFTRCVGPAAAIVWTSTGKRLGINPDALPETRCIDFLRGLADAISEANAKSKFIEAIGSLRKQFNI
jgi:hypothetical protein